ncbi:2Fe-2S iron-sulfur cluster-binding protein [Moorena sp. SIO2C4]|uniref:2Fe-2S iron-sulfur cluster-binding protein n=1 Tax=Moorena sp. SIO2C4 TaxID=2607824 RepID=UPI00257E437D|nr:2Fe-2S iron-sulfur cluster-binding protein [Moorena sp. SIO2C4]
MTQNMLTTTIINYQTNELQEKTLKPATGIQGEYLIGRHPSCDLVLDSPVVSRVHGRILCIRGQCFFTDLGSTDGSRINNEEVDVNQNWLLKEDDIIRIGEFVLLVKDLQLYGSNQEANLVDGNSPGIKQWTKGEITVRCVQVINETDDVKTFRFVAEPPILFSYKPGQFVTLDLEIDGKPVKRSYSISSAPSRPHTLEITVKRVPAPADAPDVPAGLVSNWLHDNIKVGSEVRLNGPMGKFTCADHRADKLLFISAGSGITPIMSMSKWLCDTGADVDVVFVHSARSPQDIIFHQKLQLMAALHPNFKLAITTTRPELDQAWSGYTGRLNEAMLAEMAADFRDRIVYVCGPNPFMAGVKEMLAGLDFPMENYHEESFGGKKPSKKKAAATTPEPVKGEDRPRLHLVESPSTSNEPTVVFAESGKEVTCDAEDVILDVAEQEGVPLPSGCRMGACGACKRKLIEGKVEYDEQPDALEEDERQQGMILTCVARPVGRVVVSA